ncbi:hypothetical protein [Haloarchaeobius sp. HME9146]|uniref:hypothetical protein n=1 Tax=Haloarchaeobius sp. HME9146 TaxID=2978732 RepID=UPI0021C2141C|nr:hypothetical protein [Haloarchaeobius sp. HME9146]MCT9097196.1 hypothetical protein [Haloarchaeobius sp. HME9146]
MFRTARRAITVVNRRPAVLLGGFGLAVAQGLAVFVGWTVATALGLPTAPGLVSVDLVGSLGALAAGIVAGSAVWALLAPAPLAAIYHLGRETLVYGTRGDDLPGEARHAARAVRTYYAKLLAAAGWHLLVLLAATVLASFVVFGLLLVVVTPLQFLSYHTPLWLPWFDPLDYGLVAILVVAGAHVTGGLPVRFFDTVSLFAAEHPSRAWATSLRFAMVRPGKLVRYAVGVFPPTAAFALVFWLTVEALPGRLALPLGGFVFVVLGGFVAAYTRAFHLAFFEYTVSPTVCRLAPAEVAPVRSVTADELPVLTDKPRTLVKVLVFVLLVTSAGVVRTADVGGSGDPGIETSATLAELDGSTGATMEAAAPDTNAKLGGDQPEGNTGQRTVSGWLWDLALY